MSRPGIAPCSATPRANNNTADGFGALLGNKTGINNTAVGEFALLNNTNGFDQTATGALALQDNTTGHHNTADGLQALLHNTTGSFNTAAGLNALAFNTTGSNNIGLGLNAGFNLTHREQQHRYRQRGCRGRVQHDPHRHPGHADRYLYRRHQRQRGDGQMP